MGRWSRMLARRFIEWLDVPGNTHWLDVGCGTGALVSALCRDADPASVHACDPAAALLEHARHTNADPRVTFVVAGTGSLPPRPGGYGSVTSLLALNFFPDVAAALREQRSLAGSGGVVSACVWDYAGGMQFLRRFWDAVTAGDPSAADLDEGVRFPICAPPMLTDHFDEAGLRDVTCAAIDVPTRFASFEDYWRPFLGGTGPAPSYV
ncbi:MAG: methyltransferase domain-containing protein, partial [Phycisphaerae bacterium]|nr:methyltransferase domain-containing protein [Phycisphaerae bacterium]